MIIFSILSVFSFLLLNNNYPPPAAASPFSAPSHSSNTVTFMCMNGQYNANQKRPSASVDASNNIKYKKARKMELEILQDSLYGAVIKNDLEETVLCLDNLYKSYPHRNHLDMVYEDVESARARFSLSHFTCMCGQTRILDVLCSNGADLESPDFMGNTALSVAVAKKQNECIRILVRHGARIDYKVAAGYPSLLHYAVETDQLEILREIRDAGHDLSHHPCQDGDYIYTPLEFALVSESYDCALLLFLYSSPWREERVDVIYGDAVGSGTHQLVRFIEETMEFRQ